MNDHFHALPGGHRLGEYRMERVLGSGGFSITYYAWDLNLDKPVAVKEYLPNEFALRTDTTTVRPKSTSDEGDYRWGLERFLDEARTLARFRHPHLNEVHRYFEDNNSTNGTWVNSRRLGVFAPAPVSPGDKLILGTIEMQVSGDGGRL